MNQFIEKIQNQFDQRNMREKVLITLAILSVVFVLWLNIFSNNVTQAIETEKSKRQGLNTEVQKLNTQITELNSRVNQDPARAAKDRLALIENEIDKIDEELNKQLHGFISPEQMQYVLQAIFEHHKDLKLIRVKSLPAVSINTELNEADKEIHAQGHDDGNEIKTIKIYRHGLQIEFEGSYMATLAFLQELEGLKWAFYWDEVKYEVNKYPKATVVIRIHTLSLEHGWIGV